MQRNHILREIENTNQPSFLPADAIIPTIRNNRNNTTQKIYICITEHFS